MGRFYKIADLILDAVKIWQDGAPIREERRKRRAQRREERKKKKALKKK